MVKIDKEPYLLNPFGIADYTESASLQGACVPKSRSTTRRSRCRSFPVYSAIAEFRYSISVILLLFLPFSQPQALAVEEAAVYRAVFSPAGVTIGDRISYAVTVEHDPGLAVTFTLPDSTRLLPFVLVKQAVKRPRKQMTVLHTELALFDVGEHALPTVTVTVRDTSGNERTEQVAPSGTLMVTALTDSSVTELLPIKPLKQPYRPWTDYLFPVFAGVATVVAIILVGYFVRRRTEPPSEPADIAKDIRRKIRRLEKKLEKGEPPDQCYEQLSFLIREYLERAYRIKALEKVTSEIEGEMSSCSVFHADTLVGLLNQADLVKFAESKPGRKECRLSLDQAKKAVTVTK